MRNDCNNLATRILIERLHMTSHIKHEKKWLTKSCHLCWKGIGQTPTFGVILKTNVAATATSMLQTTSQKSTTAVLTYKRNEIYDSSYHDRSD